MFGKTRPPLRVVADNSRGSEGAPWGGGPPRAAEGGLWDIAAEVRRLVVGQNEVLDGILPYLDAYRAGLAPEGRPAGIFLLLGPTGTGKTKTVESLAQAAHGDAKCVVKVNCGEFQLDHEVAKLIGAPPGYLGHRETQPLLTQSRLAAATSARLNLALVLFDEIEKAAPSLVRLLLGVLDKGVLRLGDGTSVDFERTFVFFTSNLGARNIERHLRPRFTFAGCGAARETSGQKLHHLAVEAARRFFPPEFMNRVDAVFTYQPLGAGSLERILDQLIGEIQTQISTRLMSRQFLLDVRPSARRLLLDRGTSPEYGARELKRVLFRFLLHPLSSMVVGQRIPPGATVRVQAGRNGASLSFRIGDRKRAGREQMA
jgi:ATP-dependent Clp protease ATP-binding subunit ClpA